MIPEPRGRIFQDDHFTVSDFAGTRLTGLVLWQDCDNGHAIMVFIQVDRRPWQRFFLGAGIGFWEDWGEIEPGLIDPDDEPDDAFLQIDKLEEFGVSDAAIRRIFCEPCGNNARIVIEFGDGAQVILQPTDPATFDSHSELVMLRP